ncbi:MAG: aminotransferase class I/II-fold pyridoxal phosphate-dependent enzyme [Acutalibacteraceae bacterium]|nr:aminotransferase class I/II-fold pyridoxal phosphate-dependent enzyme [Acutalibacteraceae bacterium]
MEIQNLSREQLQERLAVLSEEYNSYKALELKLDMSRGKPGADQLELTNEMLNPELLGNYKASNGFDVRNYGILDGIPECKQLFAEILGVKPENTIVFGNASLTIMYDYIAQCMIFGAGAQPWSAQSGIKFLCPVPGYDRHFAILEQFGIEMINIPTNAEGPDMDMIDELIKDEKVKGIICVPMYSNPTGNTYSDETVRRFAALKPAAKDFRVIWDNAYCVHHINDTHDILANIFEVAKEYGSEDFFIEVTSTSKITFPGAGVSVLAASDKNIADIKKRMTVQTIGYDKINQLRHANYLKNFAGVEAHMNRHAEILKPKFEAVLSAFESKLAGKGIAEWTNPNGGYFISLNVFEGCAKRTVALCKEAGVTLTGAGATYPYGVDPDDKNIRIAPTFPSRDELCKAVEILCLCVEIAAIEKILG